MAERTLQKVFLEHEKNEQLLRWKHPWVSIVYNRLIAGLVVLLFVGFTVWGIRIHRDNRDEAVRAQVLAEMDAEHEAMIAAAEEAERQSQQEEEALQIREAQAIARAFFGIRNFVEKYRYTNEDLRTYARCVTNRSEATGHSIEDVLNVPKQFTAYSAHNNLEKEYYDIALQFVEDWHNGNLKPCELKFQTAVLKDNGIWLVDDLNKEVPDRWHE